MSEQHHDHEEGGHEIDKMPNRRLFNLLGGLSALTLLACIGVVQLFNLQVSRIEEDWARRGAFSQQEYQSEMQAVLEGYGKTTLREDDGAESVRYHVPAQKAAAQILKDPDLLGGAAPYRGWERTTISDAIKTQGGMPRPGSAGPQPGQDVPTPQPGGATPTPQPAEQDQGAEEPSDGEGAGAEPAEQPEGEPAKQPAEKPADEPAKKPANEPAEKPANEPAEKPAKKPAEEPAEKPAKKPAKPQPSPAGEEPVEGKADQ